MAYWLIKSEPDEFSWDDLVATKARGEPWSGVRNHQAKNNLMAMKVGDRAFFYHSKTGLEIVGIAEVKRTAYPDPMAPSSSPWMACDFIAIEPLPSPVPLVLVKNARLSVQPVTDEEWAHICELGAPTET